MSRREISEVVTDVYMLSEVAVLEDVNTEVGVLACDTFSLILCMLA